MSFARFCSFMVSIMSPCHYIRKMAFLGKWIDVFKLPLKRLYLFYILIGGKLKGVETKALTFFLSHMMTYLVCAVQQEGTVRF